MSRVSLLNARRNNHLPLPFARQRKEHINWKIWLLCFSKSKYLRINISFSLVSSGTAAFACTTLGFVRSIDRDKEPCKQRTETGEESGCREVGWWSVREIECKGHESRAREAEGPYGWTNKYRRIGRRMGQRQRNGKGSVCEEGE